MHIAAKNLSCKMLHKMRPNQCMIVAVELANLCALGGVFNWSWYLLNKLIDDAMQAQHNDTYKFHYSWLFILISFTLWGNPSDYIQMDVPLPCLGETYHNLWEYKVDANWQKDNNIVFFYMQKCCMMLFIDPIESTLRRCIGMQYLSSFKMKHII